MNSQRKSRMAGLKLTDFSGAKTDQPDQPAAEPNPTTPQPEKTPPTKRSSKKAKPKEEPTITVNIKLAESQHDWLTKTARKVRGNNDAPVPARDRVFPQHLIGVAVELLKHSEIDWDSVQNAGDLKQQLKL